MLKPKIMERLSFDTPSRDNFLNNTITHHENDIFLGKGSYGAVFKAIYKKRRVAVKVIARKEFYKFQSLKRELNIINLNHKNVIKILKIVETKDYGASIMERFDNGKSLQFILDHANNQKIDLYHRLRILKDITNGLKFCHEHHIIHRDLKPDNIMVVANSADNYVCKIFDFGCSYLIDDDKENNGSIESSNMVVNISLFY